MKLYNAVSQRDKNIAMAWLVLVHVFSTNLLKLSFLLLHREVDVFIQLRVILLTLLLELLLSFLCREDIQARTGMHTHTHTDKQVFINKKYI